jgi:hypothetical protein
LQIVRVLLDEGLHMSLVTTRRTAMAHSPTILHAPGAHAAAPRAKPAYGMLAAATAAAAVASLVTATALSKNPAPAKERHTAPPPAASVPMAAPPGTSVPEASMIFDGKDRPIEEPTSTF